MPKTRAQIPTWLKTYHAWRKQNGKEARLPGSPPPNQDPELVGHKRELAKLKAMQLRLELAEQQKALLPRAVVVDFASQAIAAANEGLDGLVHRCASILGPLTQGGATKVEEVLRAEVDQLRDRFSRSMAKTHDH